MESEPDLRFVRHVEDEFPELQTLIDAADAVESLLSHPGLDAIDQLLRAQRGRIERQLRAERVLDSKAQYARLHGELAGLEAAGDAARALIQVRDARVAEQRARHEADAESPAAT